jgi:hypothetical protein
MATTTEMATIKNGGAGVFRQEFGASETRSQNETAAMAIAKQAETETNARYVMAIRNRRVIEDFRADLLKECKRPAFVNEDLQSGTLLRYAVPRGKEQNSKGDWVQKFIEGPTIRFVEVALRCFRNVYTQSPVIYESEDMRIINVTVTDLENNIAYSQAVVVNKTVERKGFKVKAANGFTWEPPKGKTVLSKRENSEGEQTYLVLATEDEVTAKQNALISKTARTLAMRLLPGDVVDEAMDVIEQTIKDKDAADPDGAKRKIIDAYAKLNIGPKDLTALLGHTLDVISVAEMQTLRKVLVALSNGETTWHTVLQSSENPEGGSGEAAKNGMADKLKTMQQEQKQEQKKAEPKEPEQQSDPQPQQPQSTEEEPRGGNLFNQQQSETKQKPGSGFGKRNI